MLALNLDNLLFLLLIAVAAVFQLLSKAIGKGGKSDSTETSSSPKPQTPGPIRRAPPRSDAERIRKFLEALGQPPGSTPPPPVLPRADIPPRPLAPVRPPPVIIPGAMRLPQERRQRTDGRQTQSLPHAQPIAVREIAAPPVTSPAAATFEVHEALPVEPSQPPIGKAPVQAVATTTRAVLKESDFKTDIAVLLASKSRLRQAIVLREVFGPPRGLKAFDFQQEGVL